MRVLGIDGCENGWVGVWLDKGVFARAAFHESLAALIAHAPAAVVGVDIPVHLSKKGYRRADVLAREALGGRGSTLFMIPPRAVLEQATHPEACATAASLGLKKPSIQAYGLRRRIFEADALARTQRLYEVHPELAFLSLAQGNALPRKKSWNGVQARLSALRAVGIELPTHIEGAGDVGTDDVIDAAVVAYVAARIAAKKARCMPKDAKEDEGAIWY
jgi:predicted RNase H-like nuclease